MGWLPATWNEGAAAVAVLGPVIGFGLWLVRLVSKWEIGKMISTAIKEARESPKDGISAEIDRKTQRTADEMVRALAPLKREIAETGPSANSRERCVLSSAIVRRSR